MHPTIARAHALINSLVRGDAMLGLLPDARGASEQMMQDLWSVAASHSEAYVLLGRCFYAVLVPDGAFDGVFEGGEPPRWPDEAGAIVDEENAAVEAALRCFVMAARRGHLQQVIGPLVHLGAHSSAANARIVLELLPPPTLPADDYRFGLLSFAAGDHASSVTYLSKAAAAGDANAMFELSIYGASNIGGISKSAGEDWLERAAALGHGRALYNLGARFASGASGSVDLQKARVLYEQAASAGNGRASATLAVMILRGEIDGTKELAVEHLDHADACGFDAAEWLDAMGLPDPRGGEAV